MVVHVGDRSLPNIASKPQDVRIYERFLLCTAPSQVRMSARTRDRRTKGRRLGNWPSMARTMGADRDGRSTPSRGPHIGREWHSPTHAKTPLLEASSHLVMRTNTAGLEGHAPSSSSSKEPYLEQRREPLNSSDERAAVARETGECKVGCTSATDPRGKPTDIDALKPQGEGARPGQTPSRMDVMVRRALYALHCH